MIYTLLATSGNINNAIFGINLISTLTHTYTDIDKYDNTLRLFSKCTFRILLTQYRRSVQEIYGVYWGWPLLRVYGPLPRVTKRGMRWTLLTFSQRQTAENEEGDESCSLELDHFACWYQWSVRRWVKLGDLIYIHTHLTTHGPCRKKGGVDWLLLCPLWIQTSFLFWSGHQTTMWF